MARIQLEPPGPTESCRPDYATFTFKLHSTDDCSDLVDFANDVGYHVAPNGYLGEPRPGRHAAEVREHCSGISVELTHPESPRRNAGLGVLNIPGQVFAALDAKERYNLYEDVYSWRGFYRCTRLDTQLTVLNPPISMEEFCDEVQIGNIWAKNYSSGMPYGERGRDGNWRKPPTQYFGSPESPTRARIYRHGAKLDWKIPDIRFEVQQRKRNANDTFRALVKTTREEAHVEPLFLVNESILVKNVAMEKLDLRDTSQCDRAEMGSKWLRKAPRVSWYWDLVSAPEAPVERSAVPAKTLEQSVKAMKEQYGGKGIAKLLQVMATERCGLEPAAAMFALGMAQFCKEEHRALAKQGLDADDAAYLDQLYAQLTKEAAYISESFVEE